MPLRLLPLGFLLSTCSLLTAQKPVATVEHDGPLNRTLVVYDVRGVAPLAAGPELVLAPAKDETDPDFEGSPDGSLDSLCRLARVFVHPRLLQGESIRAIANSYLVVFGRPAQQAWIRRFLDRQAEEPKPQIDIQFTIGFLHQGANLGEVFSEAPGGIDAGTLASQFAPGSDACVFEDAFADYVRGALMSTEQFDLLNAPRILSYPATDVSLSAITQTSIVRDYTELRIGGGLEEVVIADPQVELIHDGIQLRGRVCLLPEEDGLGVDFLLDYSELQRPIPVVETALSNGQIVKIQDPELRRFELEARARLQDGEVLQIVGPLTDGRLPILWLAARQLKLPGEGR
ncbi:MAG: hypothetical protein AAF196_11415 [Planctomycetota bacterium]